MNRLPTINVGSPLGFINLNKALSFPKIHTESRINFHFFGNYSAARTSAISFSIFSKLIIPGTV